MSDEYSKLLGEKENPIYTNVLSGSDIGIKTTSFNERIVAQKTHIIELKSLYPFSDLTSITSSISGGTLQQIEGEFKLATFSASSSIILDSAIRGRYVAGTTAETGIGIRIPTLPTGDVDVEWGYFDNSDGYIFGLDVTGSYIKIVRSGSVQKNVRQESWNVDKLDGSGSSGYSIDFSRGHIFDIQFTWYGYGPIEFIVNTFSETNKQIPVVVHREKIDGKTSTNQVSLPIRARIQNNNTELDYSVFVGGRQFSIYGKDSANERNTFERVLSKSIDANFQPIMSFRRKSSFKTIQSYLGKLEILTNEDLIWEIRSGPDLVLTGSVWQTPTGHKAGETSLESDVSATGSAGGIIEKAGLASAASRATQTLTKENIETQLPVSLIENRPTTLLARTISGTGTATFIMSIVEDW